MATNPVKLATEMLEHIQELRNDLEILIKDRDKWKSLCQRVHFRLKDTENDLEDLKRRYDALQIAHRVLKNSRVVDQVSLSSFSQEELKRLRRYVHPDFTRKPTDDLFRKVEGMIK